MSLGVSASEPPKRPQNPPKAKRAQRPAPWLIRHRAGRAELAGGGSRRVAHRGVLKPEAAAALIDLRQRTGRTYSAIIEEALLDARTRGAGPRN